MQRYTSPWNPLCLTKAKPPLRQYGHRASGGSGCSIITHSSLGHMAGSTYRKNSRCGRLGCVLGSFRHAQRIALWEWGLLEPSCSVLSGEKPSKRERRAGRNQRGPLGSYGFDGPPQAYHALTGAAAKRRTALQLHPLRFTQQRGPTALFRNIGSGPSLTARAHLWFASIYGKVPRAPWAPQKRWRLGVY